jgi:hypothetical protein
MKRRVTIARAVFVVALFLPGVALSRPPLAHSEATVSSGSDAPSLQTPPPARFSIHGDEITVPTPKGFCPSGPSDADKMKILASGFEKLHLQLGVAFVPCVLDARSTTVPVAVLVAYSELRQNIPASRPEVLAALATHLRAMSSSIDMQSRFEKGKEALEELFASKVNINAQTSAIDSDKYGVYWVTLMEVSTSERYKRGVIVDSMTFVRGYVLAISCISKPGSASDAAEILSVTKSETRRLVEDNEAPAG